MVSNRSRIVLAAAALSLPALALGGCGSSSKTSAPKPAAAAASTPSTAAPTTAPPSTTAPATAVQTPTNLVKNFPHKSSDIRDVNLSSCASAPSGWGAGGTVRNPGTSAANYEITVYFTNSHATTIGFSQAKVKVAAGKSMPWKVAAKFAAPSKVLCVLVGVGTV